MFEEHRRRTRTKKHALAREQSLYVRRGSREVELAPISPEPTPSQAVQASDRLAQLVAGCSPLEAQVITLRRQEMTFDEIARRTGVSSRPRSGGSSTRPASGWRPGDGGDSLARTASGFSRRSGSWRCRARRDSPDRDQGRSRRPGAASSRLLPFEVSPVTSTVTREPSHRTGLPALTSRSQTRSVGSAAGFDFPGAPGGSGRLHRSIGEGRDLQRGGLPRSPRPGGPSAGGRADLP